MKISFTSLCTLAFVTVLRATPEPLLPMAAMAIEDGNNAFAEQTATAVLKTEGLSQKQRADAEEILIRAAFAKQDYAAVGTLLQTATALDATQRVVFEMNLCNAGNDYAGTIALYKKVKPETTDAWGVAALRLVRDAYFALEEFDAAQPLCEKISVASAATADERAENALLWCQNYPTDPKVQEALFKALGEADKGGIFLECAIVAPTFLTQPDLRKQALTSLTTLLALQGLPRTIETKLALTAADFATEKTQREELIRRALTAARTEAEKIKANVILATFLLETPETVDEGLKLLDTAVRLNPSSAEAPLIQLRIAEELARLNRHEEARLAYERYRESFDLPEYRVRVRQGQARNALAIGKVEVALAILEDAARLVPEGERAAILQEAAEAAERAKRTQKLIALRQEILRLAPTAASRLRLAYAYELASEMEKAKQYYILVRDDATATPEDIHVAVLHLGTLFLDEGNVQGAIAEYTTALQHPNASPNEKARLALERGRAFYTLGQLSTARDDFQVALEAKDETIAAEASFFMVLTLYSLGEDDLARQAAEAYADRYPNAKRIPDVMLWLAKSEFNRGEYQATRQRCETFIQRWPADERVPQVLAIAARAAYLNQDYLRAIENVGRLAKEFPQYPKLADAQFLQCEALIELARYAEAAEILDALIRRYPAAHWIGEAYALKGDCLYTTATENIERYTLALVAYRQALSRVENNLTATAMLLYKIGRTLEKQDLRNEAAEQYMRLIYRALAEHEELTPGALTWLRKSVAQLRAIEIARGNRAAFETLLLRCYNAGIDL